eukprot:15333470-Ditylum_brightwellii.AAC.1
MERSKIVSPDKVREANEDDKFCVGQRTEQHTKPREPESKGAEPRELHVRKEHVKLREPEFKGAEPRKLCVRKETRKPESKVPGQRPEPKGIEQNDFARETQLNKEQPK